MPTLTTTIENISPLLVYSNGWTPGSSQSDSLASSYSDSDFTKTNTQNTTMTFVYNGTDVTLYGAQRGNHGNYQVTVDGAASSPQSGYNANGNFQVILYESNGLSQGNHTVVIENLGDNLYLDIDFVTWKATFGNANDPLGIITVDDTDSAFKYSGSDWSASPTDAGKYFAGTGHSTSTFNASMEFTFSGEAISLYGPVGATGGPYLVQMDKSTAVSYNANTTPGFQVLLYHANNLGSGNHTLTFWCQPVQQQICAIDYVNIYDTATTGSGSSSSNGTAGFTGGSGGSGSNLSSSNNSSALSTGDIIGIVLGTVAVVAAAVFVVLYIVVQKRSRNNRTTHATFQAMGPGMGDSPIGFSPAQSSMVDQRYLEYPNVTSQASLIHVSRFGLR
ncbi:hypothetical protein F5887DRAFT_1004751 [Amanita rubescens]|nr:hypothetical protein F5887DRAFT_1004751 [Amanita rubescens]